MNDFTLHYIHSRLVSFLDKNVLNESQYRFYEFQHKSLMHVILDVLNKIYQTQAEINLAVYSLIWTAIQSITPTFFPKLELLWYLWNPKRMV